MMSARPSAHQIPFLVERALTGDFNPFAEAGLRANRGIYTGGRMGLHYCITCNEFVSRIPPEKIEPETRGRFLGSWRVRAQTAACKVAENRSCPPIISNRFSWRRRPCWFGVQPIRRRRRLTGVKKQDLICRTRIRCLSPARRTRLKMTAREPSGTSYFGPGPLKAWIPAA